MPSLGDSQRVYPLTRGWVKHRLIRQLATKEATNEALGEEYGVTPQAVSAFRKRHAMEIAEVAKDIENEFSALWIAQKAARLAEIQEDCDRIGESNDPELLAVKHKAIRHASEELGQLPGRTNMTVNTAPVTYKIDGVDMGALYEQNR